MKNQFCKIFEVQGHQVLYRRDTNDEGDEAITMTTLIDGLFMSANMSGFEKNNTTAEEQFKKVDQEKAESFFKTMKDLTEQ